MADILDRLLQALAQAAPGIAPDAIMRVEAELRREFGGVEAGYVAKRIPLQRAAALGMQLQAGATLQQAIAAAGCTKSTGYRTLARPIKRTR